MAEVDHVPWQRELLDHDVGDDFGDDDVGGDVGGDDVGDVGGDVDDGDDVGHLVVGEWIPGKQLWLLSSIRPDIMIRGMIGRKVRTLCALVLIKTINK